MTSEPELNKSAIKYICGEITNVCRLCLNLINYEQIVSLHEFAIIKTTYYKDEITYSSIFHELGVTYDPALPELLCINCATLTVQSYLFQKLCDHSEQRWATSLCSLEKAISQSESLTTRTVSAYFLIENNENKMLASYKTMPEKSRSVVLTKLCKTMKKRSKKKLEKIQIEMKYPCPSCPRVFLKPYDLENHRELIHYPKTIKCDLCTKLFSTNKQLSRHIKKYHTYVNCKLCNARFPTMRLLSLHIDKYHRTFHIHEHIKNPLIKLSKPSDKALSYCCPQCNKEILHLKQFRNHLRHCGQFICDICNKEYTQKSSLAMHIECAHGSGKFTCKWCDKKLISASALKGHEVKHTRERNFTCEICGGKFVTNPALVYHKRLHTGEKPYPCDMCDESFINSSRRLVHKRKVHTGPTHECDICQAKFYNACSLKKHKAIHSKPRSRLFIKKSKCS